MGRAPLEVGVFLRAESEHSAFVCSAAISRDSLLQCVVFLVSTRNSSPTSFPPLFLSSFPILRVSSLTCC